MHLALRFRRAPLRFSELVPGLLVPFALLYRRLQEQSQCRGSIAIPQDRRAISKSSHTSRNPEFSALLECPVVGALPWIGNPETWPPPHHE